MDARDYKTWTRFEDHPIFTERVHDVSVWSSDPEMYEGEIPSRFDPEWYVHQDPKLPTDVQAQYAKQDMGNLIRACDQIIKQFGCAHHELFILDDFTVFVSLKSPKFSLELYPCYLGTQDQIMNVHIDSPIEMEFISDSIEEMIHRIAEYIPE